MLFSELSEVQNTRTHLVKLGLSRVNRTSGHPRSHFRTQWCVKVCFGLRLCLIPRVEKEQRRNVVFSEFEHMCNVKIHLQSAESLGLERAEKPL